MSHLSATQRIVHTYHLAYALWPSCKQCQRDPAPQRGCLGVEGLLGATRTMVDVGSDIVTAAVVDARQKVDAPVAVKT